jgi:hypothetical protein
MIKQERGKRNCFYKNFSLREMGMSDRITFERVRFLMKEKGIISCEKQ